MQKAIEVAEKNGFKFKQLWDHYLWSNKGFIYINCRAEKTRITVSWQSKKSRAFKIIHYSYYDLVFGTGFLECLAGEGYVCGDAYKKIVYGSGVKCETCNGHNNKCNYFSVYAVKAVTLAAHHRRELANKTLDEMKEYINTLVKGE